MNGAGTGAGFLSELGACIAVAVGPEATATVRLIMVAQAARTSGDTTLASVLFAPCSSPNTIWGGARHAKAVAVLSRHGSECVKRSFREHWSLTVPG